MKILALTFGDFDCASTYYRILQYIKPLSNSGIEFSHFQAKCFQDFDSIPKYDYVILQKTILSVRKVRKLALLANRFIYDADDRMWLAPFKEHSFFTRIRIRHRMRCIARLAHVCTVANEIIAEDIKQFGGTTEIVPMALNGTTWYPEKSPKNQIIIGWTGAPVNLPYLKEILPSIKAVLQSFGSCRFLIHCGKDPAWQDIEYSYVPFVPGSEPEIVRSFDIGLLPLPDNPFSDGKSPIKALQYLASGVPVICSKTLACENLFKDQRVALFSENLTEWRTNLQMLCQDSEYRKLISSKGLKFFEENHDLPEVSQQILGLLLKFNIS